jgi:ABC-type bacteriocin/lantibiotic exporter with double-glycine peptidase domain
MNRDKYIAIWGMVTILGMVGGIAFFSGVLRGAFASGQYSALSSQSVFLGKEKVVFQTNPNDCGICALKMMLDDYRIYSTFDEIRQGVGLTEHGVSVYAIKEFAARKGLIVNGWQLSLDELSRRQFPMILFVRKNHFVVDSISNSNVFFRDPAIGRIQMNIKRLQDMWNGEAVIISRKQ